MEEPRRPHFFKVLVGDFARRIEIPKAFLCHIPKVGRRTSDTPMLASANVILKNAQGKIWDVELQEIDGRVFLTTGWPKFVEDSCLGEGEFLVFKCDGNMHFVVLVFGVNAVEKAVWSSGTGARAIGNLEEKDRCDIFPSSKRGHRDDNLPETAKSLTCSHCHSQLTLQSTQGDEQISSQDTIGFLDVNEVGCSQGQLETYLSLKGPVEDDKAKAIAKVTRTLNVDRLTVDLFCATLSFYKWNVDAGAEVFYICRGKHEIPQQSLKQKLVSQLKFVKEQLQHFFPPDDDSSVPVHERRENNVKGPNLSNQPLQCDLAPVKRKLVDQYESFDLSHQRKRKPRKLQRGSPQLQTPRRSLRLANLNNTCNSTNNIPAERSEVLDPPPAVVNQVKDRVHKSCLLHKKQYSAWKGVSEEIKGSLSQELMKLEPTCCDVGLSEDHRQNQEEIGKTWDQLSDGQKSVEQIEIDCLGTSESFMGTVCIESESLPSNSELASYSRKNQSSFTWNPSQHGSPLEKILLDIERENFMNTITRVQKIIRDDLSDDGQTANVIEAIVQTGILKWDSCLQDSNVRRIVSALLQHTKKVKDQHNFNIEVRKEEFSAKLQDHSKWQLKELEAMYTSLESDYKKATANASICFSTLEELKKKMYAIQDGSNDLQQALMMQDELPKLRHQVSEHEDLYKKSIMEIVRFKMVLKSYQQALDEVKGQLASTEPRSIDVEALIKTEMDNMNKEIELSKRSLLNINFRKE
ncbi:hypothetical protein ACP4OV_024568 [Aristida adscensionis]